VPRRIVAPLLAFGEQAFGAPVRTGDEAVERTKVGPFDARVADRRLDAAVERRPLAEYAARAVGCAAEVTGRGLLAESRARGRRDALVHEHPSKVIHARAEERRRGAEAHLRPRRLDVSDGAVEHDARNGVHQHRLPERRPAAEHAAAEFGTCTVCGRRLEHWRVCGNERQRHELRKPARLQLDSTKQLEVRRNLQRRLHVAVHQRRSRFESKAVRRRDHVDPLFRGEAAFGEHVPHAVVEDLRRRAR